jgi:pyruvate ferredoxin oxidoreductase beta subunit
VPYVAQAAATHWHDLSVKVERATAVDGPAFLNVLTDCPLGWGHEARQFAQVIDTAVDCLFWPLYEVVDGSYRLTYEPEKVVPVEDWLSLQQRFAHLLQPENREVIAAIQRQVEADWQTLVERCGLSAT